ncbi:unnamed protein product [Rodentolepis nana]|uniref:Uncharacterized protein n=1 Tax=Rodentolepis nana TaxID=102285 RepID=A0A0R3TVD0_RODNA|nr:unnamed protein product [Rodentolepis nana]
MIRNWSNLDASISLKCKYIKVSGGGGGGDVSDQRYGSVQCDAVPRYVTFLFHIHAVDHWFPSEPASKFDASSVRPNGLKTGNDQQLEMCQVKNRLAHY